uniref:C2 domain-containing protein n=2 Tax=Macrostomum lignano TaxID=282301 RepID=A0A1I8IUJ1_9PLAT
ARLRFRFCLRGSRCCCGCSVDARATRRSCFRGGGGGGEAAELVDAVSSGIGGEDSKDEAADTSEGDSGGVGEGENTIGTVAPPSSSAAAWVTLSGRLREVATSTALSGESPIVFAAQYSSSRLYSNGGVREGRRGQLFSGDCSSAFRALEPPAQQHGIERAMPALKRSASARASDRQRLQDCSGNSRQRRPSSGNGGRDGAVSCSMLDLEELRSIVAQQQEDKQRLAQRILRLTACERELVLELERLRRKIGTGGGGGVAGDSASAAQLERYLRGVEEDREFWKAEADRLSRMMRMPALSGGRADSQERLRDGQRRRSPSPGRSQLTAAAELSRVRRERDELRQVLDKFERHLSDIQAEVRSLARERGELARALAEAQAEQQRLRRQSAAGATSAQTMMKRLEAERDETVTELRRAAAERERLRATAEAAEAERSRLELRSTELEAALRAMAAERAELASREAAQRLHCAEVGERLQLLERRLGRQAEDTADGERRSRQLEAEAAERLRRLEAELRESQETAERLEAELEAEQAELSACQDREQRSRLEAHEARTELQLMQERLDAAQTEADLRGRELARQRQRCGELEAEAERLARALGAERLSGAAATAAAWGSSRLAAESDASATVGAQSVSRSPDAAQILLNSTDEPQQRQQRRLRRSRRHSRSNLRPSSSLTQIPIKSDGLRNLADAADKFALRRCQGGAAALVEQEARHDRLRELLTIGHNNPQDWQLPTIRVVRLTACHQDILDARLTDLSFAAAGGAPQTVRLKSPQLLQLLLRAGRFLLALMLHMTIVALDMILLATYVILPRIIWRLMQCLLLFATAHVNWLLSMVQLSGGCPMPSVTRTQLLAFQPIVLMIDAPRFQLSMALMHTAQLLEQHLVLILRLQLRVHYVLRKPRKPPNFLWSLLHWPLPCLLVFHCRTSRLIVCGLLSRRVFPVPLLQAAALPAATAAALLPSVRPVLRAGSVNCLGGGEFAFGFFDFLTGWWASCGSFEIVLDTDGFSFRCFERFLRRSVAEPSASKALQRRSAGSRFGAGCALRCGAGSGIWIRCSQRRSRRSCRRCRRGLSVASVARSRWLWKKSGGGCDCDCVSDGCGCRSGGEALRLGVDSGASSLHGMTTLEEEKFFGDCASTESDRPVKKRMSIRLLVAAAGGAS